MTAKTRSKIEEYVKSLRWTPADFYLKHAFLVRDTALMIQGRVGGDGEVVEAAALLHDAGKSKLLAPGHEEISAKLAEKFLKEIKFPIEKIAKVVECIRYQNFENIEAKILRAADSMALILDGSGGREWYFQNILKGNDEEIVHELQKSYSEIGFDFGRRFIEKKYQELVKKYNK